MRFDRLANHRKVTWIGSDQLQIAVAAGGGHIAALRFPGMPESANPFWLPPWTSLEPENVTDDIVNHEYGGAPEGRLLASILGHSLALDLYGPPSKEETALGAVTHGQVGVLPWKWKLSGTDLLFGDCEDIFSRVHFSRRLQVKDSCVLIEEKVTNLCRWDRPIAWQQHVSLAPPFLGEGFWADSNCERGVTHPQSFGAGASLVPGTATEWPWAPRRDGGSCDYRKPLATDAIANDLTGFSVRTSDPWGSFVAGNTQYEFALFYLWPRQFFPWMGVWDEKNARELKPWSKRTSVRAYEFGVSPHPLDRREMLNKPSLFDTPAYLILPAGGTHWVRYVLGVFPQVREIGEFGVSGRNATLSNHGRLIRQVTLPGECASSARAEMEL